MKSLFSLLVLLTLLYFLGCSEGFDYYEVTSVAMSPSYFPGEVVKISQRDLGSLERFDVVLIEIPVTKLNGLFRVLGLPGEKIHFQNNGILIDDEIIPLPNSIEFVPNIKANQYYAIETEVSISENRIFVIGDNMKNSRDSRTFGLVPYENILGVAVE
ncbi:MAG: signal peptidase I [Verrucomicrobia bacterium]|nr:signal peptidase I [Verrucomicrobiota bacterium]MDA1066944.1 signal peptidase I [Verrucomicrobiota bacterium]